MPNEDRREEQNFCRACTSRLQTGTGIYHAGSVGKYCEASIAAKLEKQAAAQKAKQAKAAAKSKHASETRVSRRSISETRVSRRTSVPGSPDQEHAGSPNLICAIDALCTSDAANVQSHSDCRPAPL